MLPTAACAGLSGENVIVVVNGDSHISRTVANHYVEIRQIPSTNVVVLDDISTGELRIGLSDFKEKILKPVFAAINSRGLGRHARVIAYSADFPTSVDVSEHTKQLTDPNQIKYQRPVASINGLTYLYRFVLADNAQYLDWISNLYARGKFERDFSNPFQGDNRTLYQDALDALTKDEPSDALNGFETLFKKYPLAPLAIKAAEAEMKRADADRAMEWIKAGVRAGWSSATYLAETESLSELKSNPEYGVLLRGLTDAPMIAQLPVGFSATRGWTGNGYAIEGIGEGVPYMLSCMLAVVHERGSTVDQAVDVLARAKRGDRTFPDAHFWFTRTNDVRTTTRFPLVGDALLWLADLEQKAELIHADVPNRTGRCVGLMLGSANPRLEPRDWSFVPGAIADNLTSLNGHFGTSSQAKLTDLLHAGAAMASGPVEEPYSLQPKFPMPIMYGFYASGATAIEAYYLSITSPYQLLMVGDPLAQPFARAPSLRARTELDVEAGKFRTDLIEGQKPERETSDLRFVETFIEGKLVHRSAATKRVEINFRQKEGEQLAFSGELAIRTSLVGFDSTEPRVSFAQLVTIGETERIPIATVASGESEVSLSVMADADKILLAHHDEIVGTLQGNRGTLKVDRKQYGDGPIRLRPIALFGNARVPGKPVLLVTP